MREVWARAAVPIPRFRPVRSEDELRSAFGELQPPLLLKAAWGGGSVGQSVVTEADDIGPAWTATTTAVSAAYEAGLMSLQQPGATADFLVEEVIQSSTRTWWPE